VGEHDRRGFAVIDPNIVSPERDRMHKRPLYAVDWSREM
jgi:hypothetical protein